MLDSLYTEAIRKKNKITMDIEELFDESELDVESKWVDEKIQPIKEPVSLAAGDGSFNSKKFLGFNFYAVCAESLIYNPQNPGLETVEAVDLDVIVHQNFVRDRLRNRMSIFEMKTAMKTLSDFDVDHYMIDGSLLGDLIRPMPVDNQMSTDDRRFILKKIGQELQSDVKSNDLTISSQKFTEEYGDEISMTFLESIENLMALKELLKNKEKVIAISKTSTSTDLFYANIPDIAILDRFTKREGFTKPYYRKVTSEVKHDFPFSNTYFRDLWFTIFFARLEDSKNIVKIELPYYALEDDIRKILSILKQNSTEGYPFLLKRAHHDVVIKNKDMANLSNVMEIMDKSGREMLD